MIYQKSKKLTTKYLYPICSTPCYYEVLSLSIGTPKTINFPFVFDGKLMVFIVVSLFTPIKIGFLRRDLCIVGYGNGDHRGHWRRQHRQDD